VLGDQQAAGGEQTHLHQVAAAREPRGDELPAILQRIAHELEAPS